MGTIATTKNRMVPQAFAGRWSFWNRSHTRNTKATNARKIFGVSISSGRNLSRQNHKPANISRGKKIF